MPIARHHFSVCNFSGGSALEGASWLNCSARM
jgi:hypothetical protein